MKNWDEKKNYREIILFLVFVYYIHWCATEDERMIEPIRKLTHLIAMKCIDLQMQTKTCSILIHSFETRGGRQIKLKLKLKKVLYDFSAIKFTLCWNYFLDAMRCICHIFTNLLIIINQKCNDWEELMSKLHRTYRWKEHGCTIAKGTHNSTKSWQTFKNKKSTQYTTFIL